MSKVGIGCGGIREHLAHNPGDDPTGLSAQAIEEHLAQCEACRVERSRLESLAKKFQALSRSSAPADLFDRIEARISARENSRRETRARRFRLLRYAVPSAVAATILAVVLIHQMRPASALPFALSNETRTFTSDELELRDRMLNDNPFFDDSDWGKAYDQLRKGEWKK